MTDSAATGEKNAKKRIAVVGGGASGMTAAGIALENGANVTIFEHRDRLGLKLGITGKGRCNLTNACEPEEFLKNVPTNPRFLYTAAAKFPPSKTMELFESLGVPLKVERGNRVFPVSDKASDIVRALKGFCSGARVIFAPVAELIFDPDYVKSAPKAPERSVSGVRTADGREYFFDAVIIATGGLSYPSTGSTGGGYELARQAGHSIMQPKPSLVPLVTEEAFCAELMGLSLRNVGVKVIDRQSGRTVYEDFGELLFAHFGLTGPVVLSASSMMREMSEGRYLFSIDLKPALDEKTLDRRLLSDFAKFSNRDYSNSLSELLPSALIPVFVGLSGIDPRKKVNEITKSERAAILKLLKNFTLTVKGFRPIDEAIVTSGGVSVKELDPGTMASKKAKNLSFCGEVIDVDAYTGGFNLQIAFSTGVLAGLAAAAE